MRILLIWTTLVITLQATVAPNPAIIPQTTSLRVFESLRQVPQGWTRLDRPAASTRLRLRIALEEPNPALFEQTLFQVSDPGHPKYGKHLERHQVKALIKPRDESTASVMSWLLSSGVGEADIENDGEWVNFFVPVSMTRQIRTLQYWAPVTVAPHIGMIQPTTRFGQVMAKRSTAFKIALENGSQGSLACRSRNYRADSHAKSVLGVAGFLEQYAKHDALCSFLEKYAPYAKDQNFTTVKINGGKDTQNDTLHGDTEANLDIQYAASLGFKTNILYYSTGGRGRLIPDLDQPNAAASNNEP
ncbi:Tripeptidyl-peptidase [Lachnellula suecica]|uniref:Tripeptidyl-peptidase n=1 Tax=Lachnellula suecica TaxID=602035 RepID=A0A8T9C0M8_9HELO|nr:Tripeptidyl-peptidase [Lachnellula suecica]